MAMKAKVTMAMLVALAIDMNEILALSPGIGYVKAKKKKLPGKMDEDDLRDELDDEITGLLPGERKNRELDNKDESNLSDESWDTLFAMNVKGVPAGEDTSDDDGDDDNDGNEGEEPVVSKKKVTKKKAASKPVTKKKVVEKEEPKKPVTKKKVAKEEPKAPAVKKKVAKKVAGAPSNKEAVYKLWKKGKGETDVKKLHKAIKGAVKDTTIKSWLSAWDNGKNLPGCAS